MAKQKLSYADRLEARATRGTMTHQKKHAIEILKKKEIENKKSAKKETDKTAEKAVQGGSK